jgi:hypothetical protein
MIVDTTKLSTELTPLCEIIGSKKYNGYCMRCCIFLFPDIVVSKNYKTKEKTVTDEIIKVFSDFTWVSDKKIKDGCSKRRPDLLLDLGTHIIIIEIDENKHSSYDCTCENKRLMELSQDVGHRNIIFIRFNPDGYKTTDGTTIKSCWRTSPTGLMSIVNTKKDEWENRLQSLVEQIKYWLDNKPEKMVEIVELFYC